MSTSLQRLLPLFEREQAREHTMVLGTVIHTAGPTYTKAGAQMLIAQDGEYAGLLSGGCLEGDLRDRAARVFAGGQAELVRYDMRGPDDLLFGLGSGCEGAMDVLLQRLDGSIRWQPLQRQAQAWRARRSERLLLMVQPAEAHVVHCAAGAGLFLPDAVPFGIMEPAGLEWLQNAARQIDTGATPVASSRRLPGNALLLLEQPAPPRLALLGAGPDARPVAELAIFLGWSVTVIDHRSLYGRPERFPGADAVNAGGAPALEQALQTTAEHRFDAAIVMSHHLNSDLKYLRILAASSVPYIGLLGPASRRDRLLGELDESLSRSLGPRLHAPVGLDLGAATPEGIALAIVAEIHAALAGHTTMAPLSSLRPTHVRTEELA